MDIAGPRMYEMRPPTFSRGSAEHTHRYPVDLAAGQQILHLLDPIERGAPVQQWGGQMPQELMRAHGGVRF
jgi:hypothetical protein